MPVIYFITHPEVAIDPHIAVAEWDLSDTGRARMHALIKNDWITSIGSRFCSAEKKAIEAAKILAKHRNLPFTIVPELGENNRSSTGYMEKQNFEAAADAFFQNPETSFRGWETAIAAQERISGAVEEIISRVRLSPAPQNIAIISHGAVGTLYKCRLLDIPISRAEDQPKQGHYYAFDPDSRRLIHGWRAID